MKLVAVTFFLLTSSFFVHAQKNVVLTNTQHFLSTLTPELKSRVQYSFDDAERFNWNFVPIKRNGLTYYDFTDKQRDAAVALLKSSLSEQGFQKAMTIVNLENILKVIEKRAPDSRERDPLNYHYTVFGEPVEGKPWAFRFEGHHVALNFTSIGGEIISSTPSFSDQTPALLKKERAKDLKYLKMKPNWVLN